MERAAHSAGSPQREARRARRQQRRQKQERQEELNLVSMIDVFAVLVFFLLVSGSITAARLKALALDLPSSALVASKTPPPLTLSLRREALLLDGPQGLQRLPRVKQGYDLVALEHSLAELRRSLPVQTQTILRAEPDIAYDDIVQVMALLRAQRFAQIALGDAGPAT
ncbi:MAG TPA: biopolymer transporter ExbD [Solimonas sp.]|nr:biopolymer transporter ExbD [Solimonas sp.]